MPPKTTVSTKKEEIRKEDIKIEEPKRQQPQKELPKRREQQYEEETREMESQKRLNVLEDKDDTNDEASKKKKQAEMFKKYLDQTGIAMAFQVIFAEILDKKLEEDKLFAYSAMRLRQIGDDLEKIKISKK